MQTKLKLGSKSKYYVNSIRKGARITWAKMKPYIIMHSVNAVSRIKEIKFDSDSFMIGICTFASRCITNNIDHFADYILYY